MDDTSFEEFAKDIAEHGLREPIVILDGMILDGRNRLKACEQVGVPPRFETYKGDDPAGFVVSLNLQRRHLNESQRAMVAGKIANASQGGDRKSDQRANLPHETTNKEAAQKLGVSERSVKSAKAVQSKGIPELATAVDAGEVSVSAASTIASAPKPLQEVILAESDDLAKAAKDLALAKAENLAAKQRVKPQPRTQEEDDERERIFSISQHGHYGQVLIILEMIEELPVGKDMEKMISPMCMATIKSEELRPAIDWFTNFITLLAAEEQKHVTS